MNTTATNNNIDSTMASYPIAEARQSVLRSINSIDDSQFQECHNLINN